MAKNEIISALGVLAQAYSDPEVLEIMVDGPQRVLVERRGQLVATGVQFRDPEELQGVIEALLAACGVVLAHHQTVAEMGFPDHFARALAVLPPTAINGPFLVIRKLPSQQINWEDMLRFGAVSQAVKDLLHSAVRAPVNILVTGGMGSGKTTLMNRIAELAPEDARIIVVEGAFYELQMRHPRAVFLELGDPAQVSAADLVSTASKMRPDWMVVGELMGSEAMRVVEIFGRGHSGMASLHAHSAEDALARLEALCLTANLGLGLGEIRHMIAAAFQLITCQRRLPNGSRRVTQVAELRGVKDHQYILEPLFRYDVQGDRIEATGAKPSWL